MTLLSSSSCRFICRRLDERNWRCYLGLEICERVSDGSLQRAAGSGSECVFPPVRSSFTNPLVELMGRWNRTRAPESENNPAGRRERGTLAVSNKRAEEVSQNTWRSLFIFLLKLQGASHVKCRFIFSTKNNISVAATLAREGKITRFRVLSSETQEFHFLRES